MQVVNGTIKNEIAGVISTPPFLIKPIFKRGENQMTSQTISKICSITDCSNPHKGKGYCDKHYKRVRKYGDPHIVKQIQTGSPQERFDQLHRKDGPTQPHMDTPCWEWIGGITNKGYGRLHHNHKPLLAHRLSFFLHYGYWPSNALHKCDYKRCVRWGHLYEGSQKDNLLDLLERGQHGRATLTNDQVREIKQRILHGDLGKDIASDYGVSVHVIYRIRRGRTWKHIEV